MKAYRNRIRQRMLEEGLTSTDLAYTCDVSEKTMRTHINDPEKMPVGELAKLVKDLYMTPADLWEVVTGDTLTVKDILHMVV